MTQGSLFARKARCGYCGRELVAVGDRFECAVCAPQVRVLGRGMTYADLIAEYARFQREATTVRCLNCERESIDHTPDEWEACTRRLFGYPQRRVEIVDGPTYRAVLA